MLYCCCYDTESHQIYAEVFSRILKKNTSSFCHEGEKTPLMARLLTGTWSLKSLMAAHMLTFWENTVP